MSEPRTTHLRGGEWTITRNGRTKVVTHLPTGYVRTLNWPEDQVRREIANGGMLYAMKAEHLGLTHVRPRSMQGRTIGRQIQVGDQWLTVERCNGWGPTADVVRVWTLETEPLDLPADEWYPVRDPDPSCFTVIHPEGWVAVAAVRGAHSAWIWNRWEDEPSARVTLAETITPGVALDAATAGDEGPQVVSVEPTVGTWTIVSHVRDRDCLESVVAIPGEHYVHVSEWLFPSRRTTATVVHDIGPATYAAELADRVSTFYDD